ncbi:sensor histidine kinase [Mesorhizobium escarrei]|uniref:histidine kinase n=1 Tax=Mesorhizobium escarrei TaxID=666018 RepID=A0ABN8JN95_9HYPH|nr:ATP-binding protein [Mesorhizobium escarrei]CAH2398541.1 Histidine kinase [Mesorhizobium escarrei]
MKMSGAETRSGTAGNYVFARTSDVSLPDAPVEQSTAGIVHDLGNLIQVALSALNRIARDPSVSTAPTLDPVIASAKAALQRAGVLVQQTVGGAAENYYTLEQTSVSACLAAVENLIRSAWDTNVRLEVRVGRDLPAAKCDPLGLQNAVLNLVFNARDAMPDGGLIAINAAAVVHGPATVVELRIEDSGIGMTRETMLRAFDPFFTTKGAGLGGVGLPMVKRFAEETGGSVDIESTLGSGTTVILRLPAMQAWHD